MGDSVFQQFFSRKTNEFASKRLIFFNNLTLDKVLKSIKG